MTTNDKYFSVLLLALVGLFASVGFEVATANAAEETQEIVKLERVVIVGQRAEAQVVAQLPRVVVTGHHDVNADAVQVAAN